MLANLPPLVGFLVHDVGRLMRYRFDSRARVLGVTRPQWRALFTIALNEGMTQAALAERLDVERITLCRMIDRLADAGLVERRADPKDRRVWRIHLLPQAYPIVDQLAAIGADIEAEALSVLSTDERETLRDMLTRLRDGIKRSMDDKRVDAA
jgi:MarR family transcriptional regulator for hemolysin